MICGQIAFHTCLDPCTNILSLCCNFQNYGHAILIYKFEGPQPSCEKFLFFKFRKRACPKRGMILTIAAQAQKVGMGLTILSTRIIIKFLSKLIKAENMKRESANI